jgi:hypothetical protein
MSTLDQKIEWFVALRDQLREFDERTKIERAKITEPLDALEVKINEFLVNNKLENVKTACGTAYISRRHSAKIADPDVFKAFVHQGHFDLIDWRANATAVRTYIAEKKELVPGVTLSTIQSVGIRRPDEK